MAARGLGRLSLVGGRAGAAVTATAATAYALHRHHHQQQQQWQQGKNPSSPSSSRDSNLSSLLSAPGLLSNCWELRRAFAAGKDDNYWSTGGGGNSGSSYGGGERGSGERGGAARAVMSTGGLLLAIAAGAFILTRYKRCPANQIMVVQGAFVKEGAACNHGGGSIVLPILQEHGYISLEPLQIEARLQGALSLENIRVNIPSVFTVAVSTHEDLMPLAAQRLLGLNREEISHQAKDIIFGQMRGVVASMNILDINRSREKFVDQVQKNIEHELGKIGLELINVNITDITDETGYLEALGQKAAQEAIQKARVEVAEQEKFGAVGMKKNEKEASLQIAEMTRDQSIGEAEATFAKDIRVKAHEREMRVQVALADSEAVKGENTAQEEVADSNASLRVRQAEAYQLSETKSREAEAAVTLAAARAEAAAAIEVGNRVEAERRAELEAPARAEKAKMIVDAEAAAERMRIMARGEAEANFAKLDAQARGEFQLLKSKADGLAEIVQAAGGSQAAFQLLMLDHVDHLADSSAKAISNIKFDKVVVWDGGANGGSGQGSTADFIKGIAGALPPSLDIMKNVAGVEMPEYFGKLGVDEDKAEAPNDNKTTAVEGQIE